MRKGKIAKKNQTLCRAAMAAARVGKTQKLD